MLFGTFGFALGFALNETRSIVHSGRKQRLFYAEVIRPDSPEWTQDRSADSHVHALEFLYFRFGGEIDLPFFVENFVGNFVGMKAVPEV